jgi:hypothetical protein
MKARDIRLTPQDGSDQATGQSAHTTGEVGSHGGTGERLRAGKVQNLDPRIPRLALADLMELAVEKAMVLRSVLADIDER